MNAFNITFLKVFANGYTNIMFLPSLRKQQQLCFHEAHYLLTLQKAIINKMFFIHCFFQENEQEKYSNPLFKGPIYYKAEF